MSVYWCSHVGKTRFTDFPIFSINKNCSGDQVLPAHSINSFHLFPASCASILTKQKVIHLFMIPLRLSIKDMKYFAFSYVFILIMFIRVMVFFSLAIFSRTYRPPTIGWTSDDLGGSPCDASTYFQQLKMCDKLCPGS